MEEAASVMPAGDVARRGDASEIRGMQPRDEGWDVQGYKCKHQRAFEMQRSSNYQQH